MCIGSSSIPFCFDMQNGGAPPEAFAVALRLRAANSSNRDKSLILASTHGNTAMLEMAKQLGRLFGPSGGMGKKDVCLVGNGKIDAQSPPNIRDHESCLAHRKAKKMSKDGPNGDGGKLDGVGPKPGKRHRCYLLLRRPELNRRSTAASSSSRVGRWPRRPPFPSISCGKRLSKEREFMQNDAGSSSVAAAIPRRLCCLPGRK